MRWPAILTIVVMIGLLCVAGSRQQETCAVTLTLTDAASGNELSGLVSVTDSADKALFADPQERARVLDVHREGIELLNQRISKRGSQ